jgi:acyl phosphate:glycerol-3-phosphate acyltransferase
MVSWLAAAAAGYLLGSIPVAVLAARARGFDPRETGDRNPGFWNMKDQLGWSGALPVLAGDTLKGTAAGLAGLAAGGEPAAYLAVAGAMVGHAWPVFARLRGGRSVLTFAGGFAVLCPPAFALGVALCAAVALATRSFAVGARVGVFGAPVLQLLFAPPLRVAATGALMSLIGLRFAMAAASARRRRSRGPATSAPGAASPRSSG